jgi:PadR family transcriptional regulator, regulatory protein PadR
MAKNENLHGTLELLVMKVLRGGPRHGFALAAAIQQMSDDVLRVEAGSLYPALHRMTDEGLLEPKWQKTEAGRRAKFYTLTPKGRKKLGAAEKKWHAVSAAVTRVLKAT